MTLDDPLALDSLQYTAGEFRRTMIGGAFMHAGHDLAARPGVLSGMSASVSGLNVTLSTGIAIVTPANSSNGSYVVANSESTTATLSARDATYTRWDLIVLRVYDNGVDGSGKNEAALEVIKGTASVAPAGPTLPSGVLLMARVVIPSGTAGLTIVDRRTYTTTAGGVLPASSTTRPTASGVRDGTLLYELDTKTLMVCQGSTWQPLDGDTGWVDCPLSAGFTGSLQVKRKAGWISFRGFVTRTAGGFPVGYQTFATLPVGFEPSDLIRALAGSYSTSGTLNTVVSITGGSREVQGGAFGGTTGGNSVYGRAITPWQVD